MDNQFSLAGKVIVVTGGTGILGKAFIDGIVEAGGAVGILGRNAQVAEEHGKQQQYGDSTPRQPPSNIG